jgi:hypothetical protein
MRNEMNFDFNNQDNNDTRDNQQYESNRNDQSSQKSMSDISRSFGDSNNSVNTPISNESEFDSASFDHNNIDDNLTQIDATDTSVSEGVDEETSPHTSNTDDNSRAQVRRSSRVRKRVDRLTSSKLGNLMNESLIGALGCIISYFSEFVDTPENCYVSFKTNIKKKIHSHQAKSMFYDEAVQLNVDGSINYMHPLSFATQTAGNEVFYFHQAMQEDDREEFVAAMIKELDDHHKNDHWKLVKRSEIGKAPTIKAIWSFKRKRRPDGSLLKHKARLCAHGGMQIHGENFWDTYAPVVNWISIRMMLTLSVIHKLYTTSIDFTLAFPQAKTDVRRES